SRISDAGNISYRKMMGEYAMYCDGKVIGFICDDIFFLKITDGGMAMLGDPITGPPYPGAKDYLIIDPEQDEKFISSLISVTWDELPASKPKKSKTKG
ncbi:MAG: TfoX/Sxy family protein, partial [Candidatus Methanoplasma sp.]|nr:TfoX/Sxy family protein [Candidatus Methanoplasma sp.]